MPLAKSWFAHLSVVRKLTAIGVLTSTVALILACAVIFAYDLSTSRQRLIRGTGMLADVIARNSTAVLAFGDAKSAGEMPERGRARPAHRVGAKSARRPARYSHGMTAIHGA